MTFKALHDFEVRQRRLDGSREALARLRDQAGKRKLSQKQITEPATRSLVENKSARYFSYLVEEGFFSFWLRRDEYRRQRRHDGLFVLRPQCVRPREPRPRPTSERTRSRPT